VASVHAKKAANRLRSQKLQKNLRTGAEDSRAKQVPDFAAPGSRKALAEALLDADGLGFRISQVDLAAAPAAAVMAHGEMSVGIQLSDGHRQLRF